REAKPAIPVGVDSNLLREVPDCRAGLFAVRHRRMVLTESMSARPALIVGADPELLLGARPECPRRHLDRCAVVGLKLLLRLSSLFLLGLLLEAEIDEDGAVDDHRRVHAHNRAEG